MLLSNWLRFLTGQQSHKKTSTPWWTRRRVTRRRRLGRNPEQARAIPHVSEAWVTESLEDRTMLTTIIVDTTDDVLDAGDGRTSLREAINTAAANDTIQLGAGTYSLTLTSGAGEADFGDLDVTQNLTILGAGSGATRIDAGGDTGIGDRVFEVSAGSTLHLEDVTITGGRSTGDGGAINTRGIVELTNTTVSRNEANRGGGIFVDALGANSGQLIVTGSSLSWNTASTSGGAIANFAGNVEIENSTIEYNVAAPGAFGGGIYNTHDGAGTGGVVSIESSTIRENTAGWGGGVSSNDLGTLTIEQSTFSDNEAVEQGGAIHSNGLARILHSRFENNTAAEGGGIYSEEDGTVEIARSSITGNTATSTSFGGGGVFSRGVFRGQEIDVSNNTAVRGGGFYVRSVGIFELTGSTISRPSSPV